MNSYAALKLLHVVAVIVWVGGALTASLLTWRVAKAGDRQTLARLIGLQQAAADQDESRLIAARSRVARLNTIYLAVMLSVVGAMVIKPTL
jgi:uncharacterized membrane protein